MQLVSDGLHGLIIERRAVGQLTSDGGHLASQTLDEMSDCHSGGDGVGVDDKVGGDSVPREWHVFLLVSHA